MPTPPPLNDHASRPSLAQRLWSHVETSVGANCAIAAFSLLLIALLAAASIVQVRHEYEDVVSHAIKSNANLAIAYEEHTIRTLKSIDAAALFLAREYARLGPDVDLRAHIVNGVLDTPGLAAAVIVDEFGDVVAISEGNAAQFVANRDYFRGHVAHDDGTLHVGRPVMGYDTGRQAILMSRRMNHPDGSFAGVVAIAMDPRVFTQFYRRLDLGRLGLISVVGIDGVTRARRSGDKFTAGEDFSGSTLLKEQETQPHGSYTTLGRAEGIRRFTSYRTVAGFPLIVSIGSAEDEVLDGFNERSEMYIWANALIAAVILAMAALLITALSRRSRALAMLMRSDRRMKTTFNHAGIGIVHAALDGRVLQVNQQFADMLEKRDRELVGRPFFDLSTSVEGAHSAECCEALVRALEHESSINLEQSYRGTNDAAIWALVTFAMVRDDAGDPDYLVATIQNITPQKRLEKELTVRNRELTETTVELHNMLESSTLYSIVSMDLDRTIRSWNAGAYRNYGYTADEMVHRANNISVLHTPEDNANGRVDTLFATAYEEGTAEGVFERVRGNGERFTASVSVTLRRDSEGTPVGYLLISKDVTEQKILEHELTCKNEELAAQNRRVEEANRLKSEFLANMSHELRTPLNAIIGFSEIMHDEKVGEISSEHKEFLGDILTSAKHLLQLINDVLDLAKVEAGKMRFDPEPVQLNRIVNEVRDVLRTMASRKAIDVAIEIDPTLDDVVADASKLKQVLYNYLSNALKFTPDGGHVTVRAIAQCRDHYTLEVEDTGIGVEPEDLDKLFTEFRQLDTGVSKQYQGTGLGLALTKRIVEAQGGSVNVTSVPGHGSTFRVVLPRVMRGDDFQPIGSIRAEAPQSAGSVLLVEDDPSYSGWVTTFLEEHGYRVTLAQDGFEGIEDCSMERFDAILLDILLPGLDGWETLRAIRRHGLNRDTPVVVVSITRPTDAVADYPIQDFLTKPVNGTGLLRSLEEVRRSHAKSDEILVLDTDGEAVAGIEHALRANGYRPVRTPNRPLLSGMCGSKALAEATACTLAKDFT